MCRAHLFGRGLLILLGLTLLAGSLPTPLGAQSARDSLKEEVGRELDRLHPIWQTLGRRAREADSLQGVRARAEGRQVPVDTFFVGPFRLVSEPRQKEMAQTLFTEVWEEVGPMVSGAEDLLEPWTFLVRRAWSREGMHLAGDSLIYVDSRRQYRRSILEQTAYSKVGGVLWRGVPQDISEWTGARALTTHSEGLQWVARELATAPSIAVRRCYHGDLEWCREALGFGDEPGSWERWYTPPERRVAVSRYGRPGGNARRASLWEGCVEFEEPGACDSFLADMELQLPFSGTARSSFLSFALRRGGEGSLQRLREAPPGSIEGRLASVAGMAPDSLLAAWRQTALDAQPSAWAGLAKTPVAALFWFLFFGFLAARSTRWRLG